MTIFLVFLTLAVMALAYGRYHDGIVLNQLCRDKYEDLLRIRDQKEFRPKFRSRETALEVQRFAHTQMYLHLLGVLDYGLRCEGYNLTRTPIGSAELDADTSKRVARYIARERYLYLAPLESPDNREAKVDMGEKDGSNIQWLLGDAANLLI